MPSEPEHLSIDRRELGHEFPEVHRTLDQFAHFPDGEFLQRHRKFLHHKEGIEYIRMRDGELAGLSAELHVMEDCGHIPNMEDYHNGNVDNYGYITVQHPRPKRRDINEAPPVR